MHVIKITGKVCCLHLRNFTCLNVFRAALHHTSHIHTNELANFLWDCAAFTLAVFQYVSLSQRSYLKNNFTNQVETLVLSNAIIRIYVIEFVLWVVIKIFVHFFSSFQFELWNSSRKLLAFW